MINPIEIDIVMLVKSDSDKTINMTKKSLESLACSEKNIQFNVFLVETFNKKYSYENVTKIIHHTENFGFNKCMNIGRKCGDAEYVCLCNNDLIFKENWASSIVESMMEDPELISASPRCEYIHRTELNKPIAYGHEIIHFIAGWCIFQKREIYDLIGDLDERFVFWYADNDYAEVLKKMGLKHGRVNKSIVNHLGSQTLSNTLDKKKKDYLTKEQGKVFLNKWGRKKIKICISSNVDFQNKTLPVLLNSLDDVGISTDDILVTVGGDERDRHQTVEGLMMDYIQERAFEFTSFVNILKKGYEADYWFLLHDTCEVTSIFRDFFYEKVDSILKNQPYSVKLTNEGHSNSMGIYSEKLLLDNKSFFLNECPNKPKSFFVKNEDRFIIDSKYYICNKDLFPNKKKDVYNTGTPRYIQKFPDIGLIKYKANHNRIDILHL